LTRPPRHAQTWGGMKYTTGTPRGACQAKIELGEIDQDEHGGAVGAAEHVAEAAVRAVETRHLANRLAPSHDGGRRHVDQEIHPRRGHARPAHSVESAARVEPAQRATQAGAVEVAGGFPRDEHDGR